MPGVVGSVPPEHEPAPVLPDGVPGHRGPPQAGAGAPHQVEVGATSHTPLSRELSYFW